MSTAAKGAARNCLPSAKHAWPAGVAPWAQREAKVGKWAPVYGGLAVLLYRGGPLFELKGDALWVRATPQDQPIMAGETPDEAHAWCTANVVGYTEAAAEWLLAHPKVAPAKRTAGKVVTPRTARPAAVAVPDDARELGTELPQRAREYLERLVHAPKRAYAEAWLAHKVAGAPAPEDPGAEWVRKVHDRVDWLAGAR